MTRKRDTLAMASILPFVLFACADGGSSLETASAEVERLVDLTASAVLPPGYTIESRIRINCNPITAVGGEEAESLVRQDLPAGSAPPDLDAVEALWRDMFEGRIEELSVRQPTTVWFANVRLTDGSRLNLAYYVESHAVTISGYSQCFR